MHKSMRGTIKWVTYLALLLVLFVLQTTPGLFQIMGVRPILLIPFVICLSMFESEKTAAIIGALAGCLWDSNTMRLFGFSAIILLICCVSCSLLIMYLIKANLVNAMLLCTATVAIYLSIDFLFYYVIWGYDGLTSILLRYLLPMAGYTLVIAPLIFFLVKKVHHLLYRKIQG